MKYSHKEAKAIIAVRQFNDNAKQHLIDLHRKEKNHFFQFELFIKYLSGGNNAPEIRVILIKYFKEKGLSYEEAQEFKSLCTLVQKDIYSLTNICEKALQSHKEYTRIVFESAKLFSYSVNQNKVNNYLSGLKQLEQVRNDCLTYLVFSCLTKDS